MAKDMEVRGELRGGFRKRKKAPPFERRFSTSEWDLLAKLDEVVTLPVSARGTGMCLFLPKDLWELYGIVCGDRIQIAFKKHYRKKREEEEETE
jgi:hypothetical protein